MTKETAQPGCGLEEACDKLAELYTITGHDWNLRVSHTLTEPTCPSVSICPDGAHITRYRVDRGGISEGILAACDMVYREVILRENVIGECPFTNPDDVHYAKWIRARLAGSDDLLPDFQDDPLPDGFEGAVDAFIERNREQLAEKSESPSYWSAYICSTLRREFPRVRLDYNKAREIVQSRLVALWPPTGPTNPGTTSNTDAAQEPKPGST